MYKKLLDSKLKVAVLIVFIIYLVLTVINHNRADKFAKDSSTETLLKNAETVFLSSDTRTPVNTPERDFQDIRGNLDNSPVADKPYIDKKPEAAKQRLFIQKASPEQILSEDEIPPEIKELQNEMDKITTKSTKVPLVIEPVLRKNTDSKDAEE